MLIWAGLESLYLKALFVCDNKHKFFRRQAIHLFETISVYGRLDFSQSINNRVDNKFNKRGIMRTNIYIVYETTNLVNGKYYVGVHQQSDLEFDGYLGSGVAISRAIKKHKSCNFMRVILNVYYDSVEAFNREREIVNDEFVLNKNTYNLCVGGGPENQDEVSKAISEKSRKRSPASIETKRKISEANKNKVVVSCQGKKFAVLKTDPKWLSGEYVAESKGRSHSQESKNKISNSLKSMSKENRDKINLENSLRTKGVSRSQEIKDKISKSKKGGSRPPFSEEWRNNLSKSGTGKKHKMISVKCPHCDKIGAGGAMTRYHFDNCKFKK